MEAPREVTPLIARDGGELRGRESLRCSGKSAFLLCRVAGCVQRTGSGMVGAGNSRRAWNAGQRSTPNFSERGQRMSCNR